MTARQNIPTHDLYNQLEGAIPFEYVTLTEKQTYDPLHYHRHSYYEIFLFDKGGGRHDIDFQSFDVNDHSVHLVSPGQIHMLQRGLQSHGNILLFSREFYQVGLINEDHLYSMPYLNNNTTRPIIDIPAGSWEMVRHIFTSIGKEYAAKMPDTESLIRAHLTLLLLELKRLFIEQNPEVNNLLTTHDMVRRFRVEIEQQFTHLHKPSDYADRLCVSSGHLNDKVKQALGVTATQLINERLILEIKRMLLFNDMHINEIATSLNFEDTSYFNRFFKQHTQITPSEFRKQIRAKYYSE